ncbi:MAG: carboxypeptidase regulatory-like domain-containing protein [Acidobacteriota bacterium]
MSPTVGSLRSLRGAAARVLPAAAASHAATVGLLLLFILLIGGAATVSAQNVTGTILGVVTDNTGGVMPGVTVTGKNTGTGFTKSEVTDDHGRYALRAISTGPYEVAAELQGFKRQLKKLQLSVGSEATVNFAMEVGGVEETVVVTGEAAVVQTSSSEVGALVDQKMMQELPLNARDLQQLAVLQPGVQSRGAYDASYGNNITVRGSRPEQNRFLVNGVDAMTAFGTSPQSRGNIMMGVEGMQEFKVLSSDYSASYGNKSGGVITMITKGGTNEFHGSAYEYHRDSATDSAGYFDVYGVPKLKRDQFGGAVGGPIQSGKTFFFMNVERYTHDKALTVNSNVLSDAARAGCITQGGVQTCYPINPAITGFLALIPVANRGTNPKDPNIGTYASNPLEHVRETYFTARIDRQFSASNQAWAVITYDDSTNVSPTINDFYARGGQNTRYIFSLENVHTFSPHLINSTRFGLNHNRIFDLPTILASNIPAQGALNSIYLTPTPFYTPDPKAGQSPSLTISGIDDAGGNGDGPRWATQFNYSFDTEFTYTKEAHSLKFGGNFSYSYNDGDYEDNNRRGRLSFSDGAAGCPAGTLGITEFITGKCAQVSIVVPGGIGRRVYQSPNASAYVEDTIRASKTFTATVGLRYETLLYMKEKYGNTANLRTGPMQSAPPDVGNPLLNPDHTNFAPRVGLNWDVFGDGKTSLRGGGGIFYSQISTFSLQETSNNPPVNTQINLLNVSMPFNFAANTGTTVADFGAVQFNPKTARLYSYHVALQRELPWKVSATISYVGSQGRNQPGGNIVANNWGNRRFGTQIQSPDASGTMVTRWYFDPTQPANPNPLYGNIGYDQWIFTSKYNSLQASLTRRMSGGLSFGANYAFTSCWDQISGENNRAVGNGGGSSVLQYSRDLNSGYGPCAYTSVHAAAIQTTWELPGKSLTGAVGAVVGGWRWSTITTIQTGVTYNVTTGFGRAGEQAAGVNSSERPDWAPGCGPSQVNVANPVYGANGSGAPILWVNTACFALQPQYTTGEIPARVGRGPGLFTTDWSLTKSFNVGGGGKRIQLEVQMFNVTNRQNFRVPSANLWSNANTRRGTAGYITATVTDPRQMQFGAKFIF